MQQLLYRINSKTLNTLIIVLKRLMQPVSTRYTYSSTCKGARNKFLDISLIQCYRYNFGNHTIQILQCKKLTQIIDLKKYCHRVTVHNF